MKLEKSDLQLETIVTRIRAGELDLQPNFQRGEIWDTKRRQRLIDTILREWYVPAVHIVLDSNGEEVVLDGQQRLAAIRDFFDDRVKIDGRIEPHDESIANLDGLNYSTLPAATRKLVNRFVLPIITLSHYGAQEPNELFFRLNQAYNLTPPEKRNALHGPARDQVKRLVTTLMDEGLLDISTIGFSNGRLAYDDIIARTCVALEVGTLQRHINNNVVEEFYRGEPFTDATINGVLLAGRELLAQIQRVPTRVRFNKGTLQTWLVYCHWAPVFTGPLHETILADFEADRSSVKAGDLPVQSTDAQVLAEVLRQYDDRASYRVTDVSSVRIRDLAIHIYSQIRYHTAGRYGSNELLERLRLEPDSTQSTIAGFVDSSSWGASLGQAEMDC
ncbi:DUF262 domain-containing protein [Sanguibacter hominis ATCC BAA-789]|uniref:DUF262 domain-containing protein n=1 Tax=Sanguibacter hominis ATCC BAA-789 TaxID=1312740 RepID=A0A9X5IP37_9MICO|nr:DUF262 domain-containing protein [Sanguibacter hominis]NKX92807.1 DUF262 domain-containing protein [Sanguibacter hominis ATCC BAA-789]